MNNFHDIFTQAYWWLSLLGGLHCMAFSLYIFFTRPKSQARQLVVLLFALIGWYFFTGLIRKGLTPLPIHLMLPLLYPSYYLLMPILYNYCKVSLQPDAKINLLKHCLIAILVALTVLSIMLYYWLTAADPETRIAALSQIQQIDLYALLLPTLTLIQTAWYFVLIWRLLKSNQQNINERSEDLIQLRLRWINLLVIGVLINWLVRIALIYLPFYAGELPSMQVQAITRLGLLLTVYVFAFYGFHQISKAAFIQGLEQADRKSPASIAKVLDADEMAFLQDVLADQDKSDKTQSPPKTKPEITNPPPT